MRTTVVFEVPPWARVLDVVPQVNVTSSQGYSFSAGQRMTYRWDGGVTRVSIEVDHDLDRHLTTRDFVVTASDGR